MAGTRFLVLVAATLLAAGCGSSSAVEVTDIDGSAYEPSVAVFRDGLTIAWYDTRDGHGEIYARALDARQRPLGPERRLTDGTADAYEADVHPVDTAGEEGFVVAWYEKGARGTVPRLGYWSRAGAERWTLTLAPAGRNTAARVHDGLVFAAWVQDDTSPRAGIWAGWWNLRGAAVATPRRIADAGATTYNLNLALDTAGGASRPAALVVFNAVAGTRSDEIFLAEDLGAETRVTRLSPDDGFASTYPDLALSPSRAALTWFDARDGNEEVYLAVTSPDGIRRQDALEGTRVTQTSGHSIGAYTAWNGSRLGLAWCDDTAGQHEIYFAEYDEAGAARGAPRRVTNTRAGSLIPSIRPWGSGFVLVWNEYEGASGHDEEGRSQVLLTLVP